MIFSFRRIILILGLTLGIFSLKAQVQDGTSPLSWRLGLGREGLPGYTTPSRDWAAIAAADSLYNRKGTGQFRFGHEFHETLDLLALGRADRSESGDYIIRYTLRSPGAKSMNLILERFHLPAGAALYMYTADQRQKLGGWTSAAHTPSLQLGTALLWSDQVVLELNYPAQAAFRPEVVLGTIVHGYRDLKSVNAFGTSGPCHLNPNCPAGQKWERQKRSVAMIVDGGGICTGSMVNNVRQDGTPYFLSANHCYSSRHTSWVFAFNWEAPGCANPSSAPAMNQTVSGSVLRARAATSDFMLLELNNRVPESYNPYFNGWDRSGAAPDSGAGIHHPDGDIKKLSIFSVRAVTSQRSGAECWDLSWDLGTSTEGGSSGSPLFDQNGLVVGQLYGGRAACGNTDIDWYGKFSVSWDRGASASARLKDWLDPDNTNPVTLPGAEGRCLSARIALPFTQTFNDRATLPVGWSQAVTGPQWSVRLGVGGTFAPTPGNSLWTGTNNSGTAGRRATVQTQPIEVGTYANLQLAFDWAYSLNGPADSLIINWSTDCGQTWSSSPYIFTGLDLNTTTPGAGATFLPTAADWKRDTLALSGTSGAASLIFQITAVLRNGGPIYLDNWTLMGFALPSRPVARFTYGPRRICRGGSVSPQDESLNSPTSWTWNVPGAQPATASGPNPTFTFPQAGSYSIELIVSNAQGADTARIVTAVTVSDTARATLPILADFEAGNFPPTGWTMLSNPGDTLFRFAPVSANGVGSRAIVMNNFNNRNVGQKVVLYSPAFDPSAQPNLTVKFDRAYRFYNTSSDSLSVGWSADCGQTFHLLWKKGRNDLATRQPNLQTRYTPAATDWVRETVALPAEALAYPRIQVGFMSRSGYGQLLYLDNITVDTGTCVGPPAVTATNLCEGGTLQIDISHPTAVSFQISGPNGVSSLLNGTRYSLASATPANSGVYSISAISGTCYSRPSLVNVTVSAAPPKPQLVRVGDSLLVIAPPGYRGRWNQNNNILADTTYLLRLTSVGIYRFTLVDRVSGCTNTSDPITITVLSVPNSMKASDMRLYPNPSTGRLVVESRLSGTLLVRDLQGRLLHHHAVEEGTQSWNLSHLATGMYLYEFRTESGSLSGRWVKE